MRAYLAVGDALGNGGIGGEAFNFGAGRAYSVVEIVQTILREGASMLEPVVLGENRGEISRQWLDSSKARRVLGWEPNTSLGDGIARSLRWYDAYLRESDGRRPEAALAAV